ncbi:SdpI family protein [Halorubellus sp. PRR65]|uniref:SdpI family protein n=1 Tax=Halorubellus sp. PRR65 TaxID=3098148 RepID=UPI002B25EC94|nr:SdpI family protein [Halorubellus sp. PRR65]
MGTKRRLAAGVVLAGVAAAASALALPDLPARTAIHFGPGGSPDSYTSPLFAAAFVPGLMLALLAFFEGVVRVDPLRENLQGSEGVYDGFVVATLAFLVVVHGLVLGYNLGYDVPIEDATYVAVGALYVALGVAMRRVDRNWILGFRTPWTLSDDAVWERTHAVGSVALVLAGVVTVAGSLLLPAYAVWFAVGPVLAVVAFTYAHSYVLYQRRHPDGEASTP